MALGVNEGNRTRPFDSGGAGCQALHGFAGDLRQSNSPVRLLWCRMPGASWPWVRSKAIDLVCSTRVARNPRRFMALGAIEGNRTRPFDLGGAGSQAFNGLGCDRRQSISSVRLGWHEIPGASWPWVRSKSIELTRSIRVVRDPRHFMALGAIKGNRTRLFDSGGEGSQALQSLGCNRSQSNSPVRLGWCEIQGASWPWCDLDLFLSHAALCILHYPSQTGEFNCPRLHSRP